ncbi:hypothetical protein [Nocardia camponoti]|uniref:Uncharacterized protein n=1 Tax=Nocardia camponoti TaxID=1616106 RepID=A0A917Q9Q5_9NOCA|nr:hypothetical protein [Nocardia camponoti]GGK38619.1 hypothetical protein GCM10011591_07960 [Nocardia camponoti]
MIANIDASEWKNLQVRADAGELALSPDVGNELSRACDDHIKHLEICLQRIAVIENITGFGGFPSGAVLESKFSLTASGGERSLEDTINAHIEAATTAKAVVTKAIQNYQTLDEYSAVRIAAAGASK